LADRNVDFQSRQHRECIRRQLHQAGAVDFFNILSGPELLTMTDAHLG